MAHAALVTGAADRIGATIARRLAAEGYAVLIHYRHSATEARTLVRQIRDGGGQADSIGADLANREERAALIARAGAPFGPLSVLVNNASIFLPDSVETLDEALWDQHFAVHAEAPVFLARDFAAQLPPSVEGNIVNLIDERVLDLSPAYTSYTLSKAALWTATRTLAQSLAPRIRVNAIGPGPTMPNERQTGAQFEAVVNSLPLRRGPDGHSIADAVMFILSAKSMTGQMIVLDGGEHLGWPDNSAPTPRTR
jgi:NAD(P)-dependent dehydrogenase (short-subunit alcohol dehydrogenase family)